MSSNIYIIWPDQLSLRIQIYPKKGISPVIVFWGWDWDYQSYSREGSGFLGYLHNPILVISFWLMLVDASEIQLTINLGCIKKHLIKQRRINYQPQLVNPRISEPSTPVRGFNPVKKICSSSWNISPGGGENKNVWNHHLEQYSSSKTASSNQPSPFARWDRLGSLTIKLRGSLNLPGRMVMVFFLTKNFGLQNSPQKIGILILHPRNLT